MHSITRELEAALDQLDPDTALVLENAVRAAVAWASRRALNQSDLDALGYPIGYFDDTEGSFLHEPLDRPVSLPTEERETW